MQAMRQYVGLIYGFLGALGLFTGLSDSALLPRLQEREVIAACLILEAGGEGVQGMQAVMNVVENRAAGQSQNFYAEVTREKQFSCLNAAKGFPTRDFSAQVAKARVHKLWPEAMNLVQKAYAGTLPDITHGATHYYAKSIKANPSWAEEMVQTVVVKNHRFMKLASL